MPLDQPAALQPRHQAAVLIDFEKQFPQSKVLPNIYLMIIDLYRQKGDRINVIGYGEKVLKLDEGNVTAMMVVARNYVIEKKNLDRAVDLAQQAVDTIGAMKAAPTPPQYTEMQWKDYLQRTDAAALSILSFAKSIRGH